MTQEYINEGNKLIAEFCGWTRSIFLDNPNIIAYDPPLDFCVISCEDEFLLSEMRFNISWDWLMPVVEKIEEIRHPTYGWFGVWINSNTCHIESEHVSKVVSGKISIDDIDSYMSDPNAVMETKILSTFVVVVEFIKFWNQIK